MLKHAGDTFTILCKLALMFAAHQSHHTPNLLREGRHFSTRYTPLHSHLKLAPGKYFQANGSVICGAEGSLQVLVFSRHTLGHVVEDIRGLQHLI